MIYLSVAPVWDYVIFSAFEIEDACYLYIVFLPAAVKNDCLVCVNYVFNKSNTSNHIKRNELCKTNKTTNIS